MMATIDAGYLEQLESASSITESSVVVGSGDGLLVIVYLGEYSGSTPPSVSGVVWDSVGVNESLTEWTTGTGLLTNAFDPTNVKNRFQVFYKANPSAKTATITATLSGTAAVVALWTYVVGSPNTSDMIRGVNMVSDENTSMLSTSMTTVSGDLVVDAFRWRLNDSGKTFTVQESGQTELTEAAFPSAAAFWHLGSSYRAATTTSTAMAWQIDASYFGGSHYAHMLVALKEAAAGSATITLTDPVSVVTGSTAACTITRNTAASGTITYNLTSSATGVATVPATATIADGQTTGTFNVTGVSAGSATITATNSADSGETDTATANVSALKGLEITFGQANLSGLTFAWFDEASPDLFAAPTVVGTTEATDGSGVMSITLTGTSVAVGNTGYLLIYKAGATAPDDIAFFGRMTVQDIG